MTTDALLLAGVAAAAMFPAVVLIEGARRPGYDPTYHTGSELVLGERGWIQRANFFLAGMGMFAFAAGVARSLDSRLGPFLLALFGAGLIVAGVFAPDAVRGYPPGTGSEASADPTWQAKVHNTTGPVMFLALFAACLSLAGHLQGGWRLYTTLTAAAGLGLTVWTALAFQKNAANTGLAQRGMLLVYLGWIAVLGIYLITDPPRV